jgi:hypothetical protein
MVVQPELVGRELRLDRPPARADARKHEGGGATRVGERLPAGTLPYPRRDRYRRARIAGHGHDHAPAIRGPGLGAGLYPRDAGVRRRRLGGPTDHERRGDFRG